MSTAYQSPSMTSSNSASSWSGVRPTSPAPSSPILSSANSPRRLAESGSNNSSVGNSNPNANNPRLDSTTSGNGSNTGNTNNTTTATPVSNQENSTNVNISASNSDSSTNSHITKSDSSSSGTNLINNNSENNNSSSTNNNNNTDSNNNNNKSVENSNSANKSNSVYVYNNGVPNTPIVVLKKLESTNDLNNNNNHIPVSKKDKKPRKYKTEDFPSVFRDNESRNLLFDHFPALKLGRKLKKNPKIYDTVMGPYDVKFPNDAFTPWVCGRAISTYPHLPTKTARDGDPICDSYCIQLLEDNVMIAVVADGCNWGRRPMEASNVAKQAFVEYLRSRLSDMNDLRDMGHFLLQAISYCHARICEGKEDIWEAGTTTLLGGILTQLKSDKKTPSKESSKDALSSSYGNLHSANNNNNEGSKNWVWTSVTIGDCKSYHFSTRLRKITDITEGNRQNVYDAKDCGGRLGPYVGEGEPDLRNVSVHFTLCEEDDIILVLSDGVHDNLDPQTLGKFPKDIGPQWEHISSWKEFPNDQAAQDAKTEYMLKLLSEELICGGDQDKKLRNKVFSYATPNEDSPMAPQSITSRVMKFCLSVTGRGREWMEQNPKEKLPDDYAKYPGKMDHATCVAIRVGRFDSALTKMKESAKAASKLSKTIE